MEYEIYIDGYMHTYRHEYILKLTIAKKRVPNRFKTN